MDKYFIVKTTRTLEIISCMSEMLTKVITFNVGFLISEEMLALNIGAPQVRRVEWAAIPSSRGSSRPRDQTEFPTLQANSLPSEPPGEAMRSLLKIQVTAP